MKFDGNNNHWFYQQINNPKYSKQNFKIGDYFYLDNDAITRKLMTQEIINIKLGVKKVIGRRCAYMYQVIKITYNKLFYNPNNIIKIK